MRSWLPGERYQPWSVRCGRSADVGEAIAADPVLMPLFAEHDAGFHRLFAEKVREGMRDGSVRGGADADAEAMAVLLVCLSRGIALQLISTPPPARVEAIIDEAERSIRLALGR